VSSSYGPGNPPQPQPGMPGQQPPYPPQAAPAPRPVPAFQPGYGPPVPGVAQEAPSANLAMILGIVGLAGGLFTCLLGLVGIGGIVYAKRTEEEIRRSGFTLSGQDKAKIGRITGWIGVVLGAVGVVLTILWLIFVVILASSAPVTS
jgi:hypothetical protein